MQRENLVRAHEFCIHHRIEISFIYSLQELGLVETVYEDDDVFIPSQHISDLEKCIRLHQELNVNVEGIDVIQHLLKKLEATENEMNRLRNELQFYKRSLSSD